MMQRGKHLARTGSDGTNRAFGIGHPRLLENPMTYATKRIHIALLALMLLPAGAWAQGGAATTTPVARRAADVWNAAASTRANGAFDLAAGRTVDGSVAVLNGPVTVSGTIRGSLVAINADVRLGAGARVERDLIVIGGTITGMDSASLGGEILQQAELLRYRLESDQMQLDREPEYDDSWWRSRKIRREWTRGAANSEFLYVASRTYNRVEGWSFVAGPRIQRPTSFGAVNVELFGVARTAKPMRWDNETIGHDAKAELLFGKPIGIALGGHVFDVIQPTETWQLGESEVGLAAALLHDDYRDYYVRHGGELFARFVAGRDADLTLALTDEQWGNRAERDPWTLSHGADSWRPNPTFDEGTVHLITTRLRIDTRERERSVLGGWYLNAELEQGGGRIVRRGAPILTFAPLSPEQVWYSRAFVDLRRYNRIAPGMSLDLRVAAGGWLAGDPLPTQRRLSVGGPGTIPGYAFRQSPSAPDLLMCTTSVAQAGTPAQCDRVALAQAQLRSNFLFDTWRDDLHDDWWRPGFNHRTSWVLFADAGRGWMVNGGGTAPSALAVSRNTLPDLNSFKVDLGAGIDFGDFGVYWAKAVREKDEPVRFIARLQHRF
jgi:hypothetical protein